MALHVTVMWCMFHSTHSTSFWISVNNEMVTEKRCKSMAKKCRGTCLSAACFPTPLNFVSESRLITLIFVTAGFVVSLQEFDVG